MPGDRVVCVDEHIPGPETIPDPKKGEVLTVGFIRGEDVGFAKYNTEKDECWYSYWHFAPVQDATEIEATAEEVELFEIW